MLDLSVIIPTYNRLEALKITLDSLVKQKNVVPDSYEIIVVDDGSTDGTIDWLKSNLSEYINPAVITIFNEHSGPAVARNTGIDKARGKIIFFTGDDIVASESLLIEHLKTHERYNDEKICVAGFLKWFEGLKITPLMKWLEKSGSMFDFKAISDIENAGWSYFVTSNVSVRRSLIGDERFDKTFKYASFEDLEFGFRLEKKGMKIVFNKNAVGYHNHLLNIDSFKSRSYLMGKSAFIFNQMYKNDPDYTPTRILEDGGKYDAINSRLKIVKPIAGLLQNICACNFIYDKFKNYYLYIGYHDQKRENNA